MENRNKDYDVVDLLAKDGLHWLERFHQLIDEIALSSEDRLKSNYTGLKEKYKNFLCFNLVVQGEKILAFSGLQSYEDSAALRVMSRLYYVPEVRRKALGPHPFPSIATQYMLPYQINFARKDGRFKAVFLSMQGHNRRKYLGELARDISNYYSFQWNLLNGTYNTCPKINGSVNEAESCWQHVILCSFENDYEFDRPSRRSKACQGG